MKMKSLMETMMRKSPKRIADEIEQSEREFYQKQRATWSRLVPEIAFVLLKCNARRLRAEIIEIAEEAFATYPDDFWVWHGERRVPDHGLVLLTLDEAKKREWGYVAGDCFRGWRLTQKGLAFAKDVERRKEERRR
jgi:hypothetical protein